MLGLTNGEFKPCPNSPNCVSTMANPTDKVHYAKPLSIETSKKESYELIKKILAEWPRVTIITAESFYIHAEFTTKIMRYTDDVEFYFDESSKLIHYRSASRVGYSDLGLNRRRLEDISDKYYRQLESRDFE